MTTIAGVSAPIRFKQGYYVEANSDGSTNYLVDEINAHPIDIHGNIDKNISDQPQLGDIVIVQKKEVPLAYYLTQAGGATLFGLIVMAVAKLCKASTPLAAIIGAVAGLSILPSAFMNADKEYEKNLLKSEKVALERERIAKERAYLNSLA